VSSISVTDPYSRVNVVQSFLTKIRPQYRNGGRQQVPATIVTERGAVIVVANESASDASYRDWLFKTSQQSVWAHYSEEWIPDSAKPNEWLLKHSVLHLYAVHSPRSRDEIFAIHCEPGHKGESIIDVCKRGPHVHATAGDSRLAHAHIPLQLMDSDRVLSSPDALTRFIECAMDVLDAEVIPRFAN